MEKVQAVIFDMDGVLFDTEQLSIKAWDDAGEKIGLGRIGYMVHKTLGRNINESVKIMKNEFGDRYDNDAFQKYVRQYLNRYYEKNGVPVKKGVRPLLRFLKEHGYQTAVASSSERRAVLYNLHDADITDYFDAIISGDMIEKSKPQPDIYLAACEALGRAPENCYAVEDSKSGLWSAHRAGCKVIMVPDLYTADEETERILFRQFTDLSKLQEFLMKQ